MFDTITKSAIDNSRVIILTDEMRDVFEQLANPLYETVRAGLFEAVKLAELQDYLLPKLLSGEVRVKATEDAEAA